MASQVSDAFGTKTRVDPNAVWNGSFLPAKAELNIFAGQRRDGGMTAFVDFQNVWLAYNDELLAQDQFAVEDISLQVERKASSSPSSGRRAAASRRS